LCTANKFYIDRAFCLFFITRLSKCFFTARPWLNTGYQKTEWRSGGSWEAGSWSEETCSAERAWIRQWWAWAFAWRPRSPNNNGRSNRASTRHVSCAACSEFSGKPVYLWNWRFTPFEGCHEMLGRQMVLATSRSFFTHLMHYLALGSFTLQSKSSFNQRFSSIRIRCEICKQQIGGSQQFLNLLGYAPKSSLVNFTFLHFLRSYFKAS